MLHFGTAKADRGSGDIHVFVRCLEIQPWLLIREEEEEVDGGFYTP
jgi:hypothetical protein